MVRFICWGYYLEGVVVKDGKKKKKMEKIILNSM